MTTLLHLYGSSKGAIEKVDVAIATVVLASGRSLPAGRLTQAEQWDSDAAILAEPVLVGASDRLWLTVGATSHDTCMIGREAWRFEEIEPQWGRLVVRSAVEGNGQRAVFQEGSLAALGPPRELIARLNGGNKRLPAGSVLFLGALPAIGARQHGPHLFLMLEDPTLQRTLTHRCIVQSPPFVT